MRRVGITLAGFAFAGAIYLLLVDTTSLPEVYVLIAVALIAAGAFEASREQGFPEARIPPGCWKGTWRAVARVVPDGLLMCREAAAQLGRPKRARGQFRAVPLA